MRFDQNDKDALERLIERAKDKRFIAMLILNAYNPSYLCDMRTLLRYLEGESNETLQDDVYHLFRIVRKGVEPHEIIGDGPIDSLVEQCNAKLA